IGRTLPIGGFCYANGCDADAAVIKMSAIDFPTNYVLASNLRLIDHIDTIAEQLIGYLACRAGAASNNYLCGETTQRDFTAPVGGVNIDHLWRMSRSVIKGDSGGPVMHDTHAQGIISAKDGTTTLYSTIDWFRITIGYVPCISSYANPCN
ncbi:MAG: trypsin-like serine protease, partial [Candidatus Rokuibacteriota bacterium]